MDSSDPHIVFDGNGFCNHCTDWYKQVGKSQSGDKKLQEIIEQIKAEAQGNYHCIIGVSGGVDSTFLAYLAKKEFGLNPLIVHLDNGWNSKLAVKNIKNMLSILGLDLFTHVIDWEEFRKMQRAYFDANVVDIEVLTDHAILATLYRAAKEHNIRYILQGFNMHTELILPKSWTFNKGDTVNIKDIVSKHSNVELKSFPILDDASLDDWNKNFKPVNIYEYYRFEFEKAKTILSAELKYTPYENKHFESVFTRFYQGYILPRKFGIDKRRAHLSCLVCMGEITRERALEILKAPVYDSGQQAEDYDYVIKKLGYSKEEFEAYLDAPEVSHFAYKTNFQSVLRKKINLPDKWYNRIRRGMYD